MAALPIPQLRGDGIWDSAVPALGLCACVVPAKGDHPPRHDDNFARTSVCRWLPQKPTASQVEAARNPEKGGLYSDLPAPRWTCLKRLSGLHLVHQYRWKIMELNVNGFGICDGIKALADIVRPFCFQGQKPWSFFNLFILLPNGNNNNLRP